MASGTRFMRVDGVELEYQWLDHAGKQSPILVLLHEALGCAEMWKDFPSALNERTGCAVLNFSRQGHGRSAASIIKRDQDYLHHEALSVLPSVLAACGVDETVLLGHSDGASIALIHAAARPKSLRGIILEAPHVIVEDITLAGIRAAGAVPKTADWWNKLRRYHGTNTEAVFSAWHDTWLHPAFRDWSILELLPNIQCPVLVIQGDNDQYGTARQVDTIGSAVSGPVTVIMVAQCGHVPHRDQRSLVIDAVTRFLSDIKDTPR